MKIKHYLSMVPVGVLASIAMSIPTCASQLPPCSGSQTVNGTGCNTGCPPFSSGCCAYTEFRVNCDEGPDQFYRERICYEIRTCQWLVIPKQFECSAL